MPSYNPALSPYLPHRTPPRLWLSLVYFERWFGILALEGREEREKSAEEERGDNKLKIDKARRAHMMSLTWATDIK
jgi:hypothetical protein